MKPDPIVEEVRAAREAYARKFNYDLKAMVKDLKERQERSGRQVVTLPPRPVLDGEVSAGRGPAPRSRDETVVQ